MKPCEKRRGESIKGLLAVSGEGQKQNVDDMLAAALQYYGGAGLLDNTPVPLALEREKPAQALASPLRYPGKLAADLAGNRLFVSDSNNHRQVAITYLCSQVQCKLPTA